PALSLHVARHFLHEQLRAQRGFARRRERGARAEAVLCRGANSGKVKAGRDGGVAAGVCLPAHLPASKATAALAGRGRCGQCAEGAGKTRGVTRNGQRGLRRSEPLDWCGAGGAGTGISMRGVWTCACAYPSRSRELTQSQTHPGIASRRLLERTRTCKQTWASPVVRLLLSLRLGPRHYSQTWGPQVLAGLGLWIDSLPSHLPFLLVL
ncbi:hypothetical protein LEMLEM_LOCUS27792, partial [Lemmus lemmus]